jgi:hypothetical protein
MGSEYSGWTAVDAILHRERLEKAGYTDLLQVDLEDGNLHLPRQYDTAILLHILEHLFSNRRYSFDIAAAIKPGGSLDWRVPVVPGLLAGSRETAATDGPAVRSRQRLLSGPGSPDGRRRRA